MTRAIARSRLRRRPDAYSMLAAAVVSAPVVGELIRIWRSNFYPTGDDAVEGIRAHDVFSLHTPLVGMFSGISAPGGPYVYHLGPMVFWALAIPDRLFSERMGIVIAAAMVNIVAAVALLRSVRRSYGHTAALAAAAIVATTCWSLGRNTLAEPWTPYIALIPLMLVLVYSLELANGALAPLPWTVLAASFVVQAHYVYALIVFASVAAGIVLGVTARRRARAQARDASSDDGTRRAVVAAALVTVTCWSLPLLDVLLHWPGNITHWIEALEHPRGYAPAASTAWNLVTRGIGWVPLAVRGPLPTGVLHGLPAGVTALTNAVAGIVVCVVVVLTFVLWSREPPAARLTASAGVLVGALAFTMWRLPWTTTLVPPYRVLTLWPVGAYVWTAAIVGLAGVVLRSDALAPLRRVQGRFGSAMVAIVAVAASIVAVMGAASGQPNSHPDWAATSAVVHPTLAHLPHGRRYLIRGQGGLGYFVQYGIMRVMLDHGYAAFVRPDDFYLQHNHATTNPHDQVVLVTSGLGRLPSGARLIAQYAPNAAADHAHLLRTESAALAALRKEPLRLTPYGEQQLRDATGTERTALEAVAHQAATPDELVAASLVSFVSFSRVDSNPSRDLFVVGPHIAPTLVAYAAARQVITSNDVRVALLPSPGAH